MFGASVTRPTVGIIIRLLQLLRIKERVAPIFSSLAKGMADISRNYTSAQLTAIYKFLAEATETLRTETAKLGTTTGQAKTRVRAARRRP